MTDESFRRIEEYPQTFFMKIEGENFREARIIINSHGESFSSEIDIVLKESKKIWAHVGLILNQGSKNDAVDNSLIKLRSFLRGE